MQEYLLYSTSACHLCELAEGLLHAAQRSGRAVVFRAVDVADSDDLFARYGERIPVLRHPDGRELDWPFDGAALERFLS